MYSQNKMFIEWIHFISVKRNHFQIEEEQCETLGNATILGCYSTFPNRKMEINNFDHLCYFKMPETYPINLKEMPLHKDLAFGKDLLTPSPINPTLQFLVASNLKLDVGDIVTSVGCLGKLLATPYNVGSNGNNWTIQAMKFKGKLYLIHWLVLGQGRWAIKSANAGTSRYITSNFYNLCKCCCTKGDICNSPSHLSPEHGLSCVFHRKVGNMSIVYSGFVHLAEEQKICSDIKGLQNAKFISVRVSSSKNTGANLHQRFLRYNCEFKLNNIQKFAMAESTQDYVIEKPPQMIESSTLQELCNNAWDESVCVKFLKKFLLKVQDLMKNVDSLDVVYEFKFNSFDGSVRYRKLEGEQFKANILSQSYIDFENSVQ